MGDCFPRYFEIIIKWMKITDRRICEDQIVTFKQSHILLYQGLLFLTRSICVIVDARSHTCKSHDFIPRYDIIDWILTHVPGIGDAKNKPWYSTAVSSRETLLTRRGSVDATRNNFDNNFSLVVQIRCRYTLTLAQRQSSNRDNVFYMSVFCTDLITGTAFTQKLFRL